MKRLTIRLLIYIAFTACLLSCSQIVNHSESKEDSYTYSIPVGTKLILNQTVKIKAELGRAYFQNGKILSKSEINIYYPHCSLTTNSILDYDRLIQPAQFEIYKIIDDEEFAQGFILFASTGLKMSSDGPLITGLVSYYYLRTTDESDVRTLECIQWDTPYENRHLSVSEIRKSLGKILTLKISE